jgi:endoglucanase
VDLTALLKKLSNAQGLSGHEEPIREIIAEEFKRYTDEIRINRLGSVIGIKRGRGAEPRRKIMLAAHMDEIGLMVAGIEKGFLRLARVGGTDVRVILGQEILVHGRRELPGVIGFRPPHVLPPDQRDKAIPLEDIFADVGLPAAQVEKLVRVGDLVSFRHDAIELKGGLLSGKAMDDRASVAAVIVCLDILAARQPEWDTLAVATIQEETRLLGAATTAYELNPDAAIAIDVTFGAQNGVSEDKSFELGKGPTVGLGPNMHPRITQKLLDTAEKLDIDCQVEPVPGASGTDGWYIQVAREGIPTGVIGIPLRYMHTPVETVNVKDVERTGRLLAEFICSLDAEFVKTLTFDTIA